MSLEFRFRRNHHLKEHEFIDKINNLLTNVSVEIPKINQIQNQNQQTWPLTTHKIPAKTKSLVPKFTLFQFSFPNNPKRNSVTSTPLLPASIILPTKTLRIHKSNKPKIPSFITPKPCRILNKTEDNMGRYKKILNLTQTLIDKDNLEGWT